MTIRTMEKYLIYDADSLEEMLAACTNFKERQNLRSALRELKGIKLDGSTVVTYSFDLNTVKRLSSYSSPRTAKEHKSTWQQSNGIKEDKKINRNKNKSQNPKLHGNSDLHINGFDPDNQQQDEINKTEKTKFRSYLYAGCLSSPNARELENEEKVKEARQVYVRQTNCVVDPKTDHQNGVESVINRPTTLSLSLPRHETCDSFTSPGSVFTPSPRKSGSINSPSSDLTLSPRKTESVTSPRSNATPSPRKPRRISYRTSPFSPTSPLSLISSTVSRSRLKSEPIRSESVSLTTKPPLGDSVRLQKEPRRSNSVIEHELKDDDQNSPLDDTFRLKKEPCRSHSVTEHAQKVNSRNSHSDISVKVKPHRSYSVFEKDLATNGKHFKSLKTAYLNEKMKSDKRRTNLSIHVSSPDISNTDRMTKSFGSSYLENIINESDSETKRRTKSDGSYQDYIENDAICDKNSQKKKPSLSRKNRVELDSPKVLRRFRGNSIEDDQSNDFLNVPTSETICNPNERTDLKQSAKKTSVNGSVVKTGSVRRKLPEIPVRNEKDVDEEETIHQRTIRLLQERRNQRREKFIREKEDEEKTKESTEDIKKSLEEKLERSDSKRKANRVRRELQLLNRENELKSPRTTSLSETLEDIKSRKNGYLKKESIQRPVQRSKSDIVRTHKPEYQKESLTLIDKIAANDDIFSRIDTEVGDEPMTPERKINLIGTWMQEEARLQELLRKSNNFSEKRKMRAEVRHLRERRMALEGSAEVIPSPTVKRSVSLTAGVVTHAILPDSCRVPNRTTEQLNGQPSLEELRRQLSEATDYDEKRKIRLALRQLRQSRDGPVTSSGLQRSQSFVQAKTTQLVCNGDIESHCGPLVTRSQSVTDNVRTHKTDSEGLISDSNLASKSDINHSSRTTGTDRRKHSSVLLTDAKPHSDSNHSNIKQTNLISLHKEFRKSTSDIPSRISSSSSDGSGRGSVGVSKHSIQLNGDVRLKEAEAGSPPPLVKKRNSFIEDKRTGIQSVNANIEQNKGESRNHIKQSENNDRKDVLNHFEVYENGNDKSGVKLRTKSSNILISRSDVDKNRASNKLDNFVANCKDSTTKQSPERSPKDISKPFRSEYKFGNIGKSNNSTDKANKKTNLDITDDSTNINNRLSPDLLWLENKKKSIPTPNELDKLMSTMDIEAAFSEILDAVEQFPENYLLSEPQTQEISTLEEESNESGVESCESMDTDLNEENKSDTNVVKDRGVPNKDIGVPSGLNEINYTQDAKHKDFKENVSEFKTDINGHHNNDENTHSDESAITPDTGIKKSEAQIQLCSTLSLDITAQPDANGAISVIHGDDGTVTVQEVNRVEDGDMTITEWKKIRRTHSKTETRETDTIIEKKVTSPGGNSLVYEKDVSKTKRKLTSRGSDYFSRNHYNIRRTKDKEGTEIVQHELSTETENMSVTKNESWGDKSEATVMLNREDSLKRTSVVEEKLPPTIAEGNEHDEEASKESNGLNSVLPLRRQNSIVKIVSDNHSEKIVEANLGRPSGCPEVTSPLQEASATEGSSVTMECTVFSFPLPTITWYKGDNPLTEADHVHYMFDRVTGKVSLEISPVKYTDTGDYKCFIENTLGTASTTGRLNVKRTSSGLPSFITDFRDIMVVEGHSLILECKVSDTDKVSWYRDGIIQRHSADFKQTFDGTMVKLEICEIFLEDFGTYTCALHNTNGEKRSSYKVTVTESESKDDVVPMFLRKPETQIADEHDSVIIECDVIGSPQPIITWHHDRSEVTEDGRHKMSYDGRVARLIIKNVGMKDGGKLECVAENSSGRVSTDCLLIVKAVKNPPVVTRPLLDSTMISGKVAILECHIEGDPTPEMAWRKNGRIIGQMFDFKQTYSDGIARLEIKGVCPQDSGCYECVGTNASGEVTTSCKLTVQDKNEKLDSKVIVEPKVIEQPKVSEAPEISVQTEKVQTATVKKFPTRFVPKVEDDQIHASKSQASKVMLVRNASLRNLKHESREIPLKRTGSLQSIAKELDKKLESVIKPVEDIKTSKLDNEDVKRGKETSVQSSEKGVEMNLEKDEKVLQKYVNSDTVKYNIKTDSPENSSPIHDELGFKLDLNKNYTTDMNSNIAKASSLEEVNRLDDKSEVIDATSQKAKCSDTKEEKEIKDIKPVTRFKVGGEIRRTQSVRTPGSEKPEWLQVKLRRVIGNKTPVPEKEKQPVKQISDISSKPADQETPISVHKEVTVARSESARSLDRNSSPGESARSLDRTSSPALKDSTNSPFNLSNRNSAKLTPVSERAKIFQMNEASSQSGKASPTDIISKAIKISRTESMRAPVGHRSLGVQRSHSFKMAAPSSQGDVTLELSPQESQAQEEKGDSGSGRKLVKLWDPTAPSSTRMDYSKIQNEEELNKLLSGSDNFDERKKIRARIKEVREQTMKEWEAKRLAREQDSEDMIKKRHREADLEKQKKMEAFKQQAAAPREESKHLALAEKQLREKHHQADIAKKEHLASFDHLTGVHQDNKGLSFTQQQLKEKHHQADISKQKQLDSYKTATGGRPAAKASPMNAFKQMDAQANPQGARTNLGAGKPNITRSPSAIKTMLLEWTKAMTREYIDTIEITNFSTSWNDGIAFCALIHHFYPEAFNFKALDAKNRRKNFELAFDTAEKYADIAPLLDVEDMVRMKKPDWKCVFTYVQSFYRKLKDHDSNKVKS